MRAPRPVHRGPVAALAGLALVALAGIASPAPAGASGSLPEITATFTVGANPQSLAITPDGRRVVTANDGTNDASIIDLPASTVTSVAAGSAPRSVAVSPDGTRAYVTNSLGGSTTDIDIATALPTRTIALNPRPGSVVFSGDGATALVASSDYGVTPPVREVARIRVADGTVLGRPSVPAPYGLTVAPNGTDVIVASAGITGYGRASLLTAGSFAVRAVSLPGYGPVDSVFSPDSRLAYIASSGGFGGGSANLAVVDVASATRTTSTDLASNPSAIAIAPDGSRVFVTIGGTSSLASFDASGTLVATTAITGTPDLVEVSPAGDVLVTTTEGDLVVLDAGGTRVRTTIALGGRATALRVAASGTFAALSIGTANRVAIVSLPAAEASGPDIPTAPLQQYEPADGAACGADAPQAVDFPGIAHLRADGWSTSWAQWANGGAGGTVCSRQPYYTSAGRWSVS